MVAAIGGFSTVIDIGGGFERASFFCLHRRSSSFTTTPSGRKRRKMTTAALTLYSEWEKVTLFCCTMIRTMR
ncbi:uncharacterized protein M6B38_312880 [Iris pallida]|uniref:Uncharacterized protein n=1 Tax=Iris pallida TaxID=29817 RepID=A0AAX6HGG5_IRIPA|nr:uncharacterized protein M6B38_312880 [Iris pallida]